MKSNTSSHLVSSATLLKSITQVSKYDNSSQQNALFRDIWRDCNAAVDLARALVNSQMSDNLKIAKNVRVSNDERAMQRALYFATV